MGAWAPTGWAQLIAVLMSVCVGDVQVVASGVCVFTYDGIWDQASFEV